MQSHGLLHPRHPRKLEDSSGLFAVDLSYFLAVLHSYCEKYQVDAWIHAAEQTQVPREKRLCSSSREEVDKTRVRRAPCVMGLLRRLAMTCWLVFEPSICRSVSGYPRFSRSRCGVLMQGGGMLTQGLENSTSLLTHASSEDNPSSGNILPR